MPGDQCPLPRHNIYTRFSGSKRSQRIDGLLDPPKPSRGPWYTGSKPPHPGTESKEIPYVQDMKSIFDHSQFPSTFQFGCSEQLEVRRKKAT
ncbi:hypothetical protein BaRGS_00015419 [Batillaria attramentaria]|uniref:Uncharacterized protein n=1 Tax=Batillaria attramentaria TaxID=370345 RepID=A0ABD0L251_9CAEN